MLVDSSIVVLENIYRHFTSGMPYSKGGRKLGSPRGRFALPDPLPGPSDPTNNPSVLRVSFTVLEPPRFLVGFFTVPPKGGLTFLGPGGVNPKGSRYPFLRENGGKLFLGGPVFKTPNVFLPPGLKVFFTPPPVLPVNRFTPGVPLFLPPRFFKTGDPLFTGFFTGGVPPPPVFLPR